MRRGCLVAVLAGLLVSGAAAAAPGAPAHPSWSFRQLDPAPGEAAPAAPLLGAFPLQFVLDDGSAEGAFGVAGQAARQFLWFQRFTPTIGDLDLEEIWVLFPQDPQIGPGDAIQLVVYRDPDGDPASGAELLLALDETVQSADGATFSVYPLAPAVEFRGGGDLYLGVVNRYVESGVTPLTQPAASDTGSSQGRSWVATWTGDPPDPPLLPPDQSLFLIDDFVPGNWMIRGFGRPAGVADIPALGPVGQVVLALLLCAGGAWAVRRRRPAAPVRAPASAERRGRR